MKTDGLRSRKTYRRAAIVLAMVALWGACSTGTHGATDWATGTSLRKRLAQPVGISWSENPLRQALGRLSRTQRVAILIDRRVDPGQQLDLQCDELPLEAVLGEIARDRQLGVSLLGSVVYFGPPQVASRLRTIAALRTEEVRRLATAAQRTFLLPKRIAWDDFATPRDLLVQVVRQNGLNVEGLDRVPHDLWAAADLPPMSLVDRLTLILAQFDLTFQAGPNGKTVLLVPVPDDVALVRSYPGGTNPQATAEKYAALVPGAQVKLVGSQVYVKGLLEAHERIGSARQPPKPQIPEPAEGNFTNKRFTLRVEEKPVGAVLGGLAEKLGLDLRIDHEALQEAEISLDARVSLSVKDATIDKLLRELLAPAGLRFRRRGNVVEIGTTK